MSFRPWSLRTLRLHSGEYRNVAASYAPRPLPWAPHYTFDPKTGSVSCGRCGKADPSWDHVEACVVRGEWAP